MREIHNTYRCATDIAAVREYIGEAKIVAFDFETAPDEAYRGDEKAALDPAKSHICSMSLSVKPHTGIMIPIAHRVGRNMSQDEFYDFLRKFLTDTRIIKVAHNIAFESMFAYANGIVIQPPVYDTIAASQLVHKGDYSFRSLAESGLKTLAKEICFEELPTFSTVTEGKHFDELNPRYKETIRYSCADADMALRLYHEFNSWFRLFLPRHRTLVEEVESPTAVYLGIMKCNGVPIDRELMCERKRQADEKKEQIRSEIAFMIGDVDIGSNCSTKAFKQSLYEELELPVLKTTETNKEALDDATMVLLKEWCDENRPELSHLFELVQEYRKWHKISSTYIDGYMKYINCATWRIHPNFYSLSTDTGRFSCSAPNMQNCPRKTNDPVGVRDFIKAPEGYLIVSCDYSQIELRVGAYYCRDETMLETYRKGGDIHAATTSVIFGIPYERAIDKHADNYKERRTIAKNMNFGVFYGLYPRGLQNTLKFKAGLEKSISECEEMIANLKAGYPALSTWQEATKSRAYRSMYSETALGRRRYLPDIRSKEWSRKSFAQRCSMNTPIQGTAADIIKLAVGRILLGLSERPWLRPILQIHDELTFIVPKERVSEAVTFIKECMQQRPFDGFDLPLEVEASVGVTFGQMEEMEENI